MREGWVAPGTPVGLILSNRLVTVIYSASNRSFQIFRRLSCEVNTRCLLLMWLKTPL
jgi:hypothetical protein